MRRTPPLSAALQTLMCPFREEINGLVEWCTQYMLNLLLNISRTKKLVIDFRKKETRTLVYFSIVEVDDSR